MCACCFCVSASIHKLCWHQARRVSEKGLFSFPLRDWTDSGKRNLCEREQRGILLAHDTLSFLHGWLSHAFPSFLTCYLQWCMPDLSRISFVLFTHCFWPFKIFHGVSHRLVHCAGHPHISFLTTALVTSSCRHFPSCRRIEFCSLPPCALSHAHHHHQSRTSVSSLVFYCWCLITAHNATWKGCEWLHCCCFFLRAGDALGTICFWMK